ncbi:hypothetical protein A9K71_23245 [Mesorhizobium sp. WSM3873]|nr:hypothetical protein A9K71_23245 [Mesorhizobium sp. WSM3873]
MCGDAKAWHHGSQGVSAEPLKTVPQRVPNRAKCEWNAKLLLHQTHDAGRMAHSGSLKIRMHTVQSEFAYQEINLANRDETAHLVQASRYAVHIEPIARRSGRAPPDHLKAPVSP